MSEGFSDQLISSQELLVQQRQHETQMAKINHMQEFVDKFRYNAKRASLVQSRIKAIEREDVNYSSPKVSYLLRWLKQ